MKARGFVVCCLLAGALPLSAQSGPGPGASGSVRLPKLFQSPPLPGVQPPDARKKLTLRFVHLPTAAATTKPRVVCGMTLIDGDPKIDPKMQLPAAANDAKHTIHAVRPSICNAAEP